MFTSLRGFVSARFPLTLVFTLFLATALPLAAQDDEEFGAGGDIIELSPFIVSTDEDVGYLATNTISGTSLNTPIKDLPMPIEAITSEFLDDRAATTFEEALDYSSGIFTNQFTERSSTSNDGNNSPGANTSYSNDRSPSSRAGVGGRFSNAIIIRGFNTPFQNREGFRYGGLIAQYGVTLGGVLDTVNVDRLEVVRGPNSLLYGIGVLAGIVNVIPKRPQAEFGGQVRLGVGSEGYRRATADVNVPIFKGDDGSFLSTRFATAQEQRDHWTDFRTKDLEYYVGQLRYQNSKIDAFAELQYLESEYTGIGDQFIYDNLVAAFDQDFRNEFGEQINWTQNPNYGDKPQSYRITGPDTYHWRRETNFLANVDYQVFEGLTLSAGVFLTEAEESEFDVNLSTVTNEERTLNMRTFTLDENPAPESQAWIDEYITAFPPDPEDVIPNDPRGNVTDWKAVRYWWVKEPLVTETEQYRVRATYTLEHDFLFDTKANHTFLLGRHDIQDEADFTEGRERIGSQFDRLPFATNDPLLFRNINNHEPIRYNGEIPAQPGREFRNVKLWFQGHYGIYQGQFFDQRLTLIAGLRHDRYHALDREYFRQSEGLELIINPENETDGFIEDSIEYGPNPDPEKDWTGTLAASFRITDGLSVYALQSEGITPNTGARDGNWEGVDSEQSTSSEIGLKFDLWEGKVSGTLSFYKIERENALWYWGDAPAPAKWVGGFQHPFDESDRATGFEPEPVRNGDIPLSYGVDSSYFPFEIGQVIRINPDTGRREFAWPEGLLGIEGEFNGTPNPQNIVFLDYAKLDTPAVDDGNNPTGQTWRHYLEQAFADTDKSRKEFRAQNGPDDIDPIAYRRTAGTDLGLNTSINPVTGANVTYTDEATGYDFQLILSPLANWQIILNYAHTEREATSPFFPVSVDGFGTEYDIWVRTFGRAAFGLEEHDDDGDGVVDRITKNGEQVTMGDVDATDLMSGLQGTSLYFGSEDEAAIWTSYTFREGTLQDLQVGFGGTYTGPAATSVAIGGNELAENQFRTPDTEERWKFDALLAYEFSWYDLPWRVQFNVYNVFDDIYGLSTVTYEDTDGSTERRRTENFYAPRSYRLSLAVDF